MLMGVFLPVVRPVAVDWECDEGDLEHSVDKEVFSFLNGCAITLVPFFTDFLRDAALPEKVEDFIEEASVDFGILKRLLNDLPD